VISGLKQLAVRSGMGPSHWNSDVLGLALLDDAAKAYKILKYSKNHTRRFRPLKGLINCIDSPGHIGVLLVLHETG
jgi:hypothetical protein